MKLTLIFSDDSVQNFGDLSHLVPSQIVPHMVRGFCFRDVWCEFPPEEFVVCVRDRVILIPPEQRTLHHVKIRTTHRTFYLFVNGDVFATCIVCRDDAILREVVLSKAEKQSLAPKLYESGLAKKVFTDTKGELVNAALVFLGDWREENASKVSSSHDQL